MVINDRGVIELINPQTERMFGYKFEDLVGKHVSLLLPKSTEFAETTFEESLISKLVGRVKEVEGLRLDGDVFPVELTFENYITAEGERFLVNMLDVSERHEVERLKREFVSTVSHELRTPLTAIRGSLGLLALGALGDLTEKAHKVVKIAERNSIRLINLINDLLDIEKLEAGKLELAVDETALAPIVERSVESVRAVAEQYGIRIEVQNLDATVFADGDRLVQVLVNLLSNGIKYSPREDVILLTVEDEPEQVRVRVTDHGRGIPPDLKEKIFERFQQVEVADAKQKGGTGLGLAICKAIVEQHKGEIGVESEEGKGSTFWFSIPKAGSPRALEWARERGQATVIQISVKNDLAAEQKAGEGQLILLADTNKVAEERS